MSGGGHTERIAEQAILGIGGASCISGLMRGGYQFWQGSHLSFSAITLRYSLPSLEFPRSHFDVQLENMKVISFHRKMGAIIMSSDELNVNMMLEKQNI
jgi:hypothetical protein